MYLPHALYQQLHALAVAALPREACGVLVGLGVTVQRLIPMRNCASNNDYFAFDSQEQLALWRQLRSSGENMLAIYHSHTDSAPTPSASDIAYAQQAHLHYLIIAARQEYTPSLRSFRIIQGQVTEETIILT